jgi:hypothetical protein
VGSSVFSGPGDLVPSLIAPPVQRPKPLTRAQKLAKALKACAKKPKRKRRACRVLAIKRYKAKRGARSAGTGGS